MPEIKEPIISTKDIHTMVETKVDQIIDDEFLEHEEEYDDTESLSDDEIEEQLNLKESFDVFEDVINKRFRIGDMVSWQIKKDGVLVATRKGMSSWNNIQKEFGAGQYRIRPRSSINNAWLKSQALILAEYIGDDNDDNNEDTAQGFDINSILSHQASQARIAREEATRREQRAEDRTEKSFERLITMMGNKNDGSNSTLELMKIMMDQKRDDDVVRREEKREDERIRREDNKASEERLEKLLLTLGTNKEDTNSVGAIEHFNKLREVEREAKKDAKEEFEEIERKAKEKAEELAEGKGEKTMADKAIEGILETIPLLTRVYAKNSNAGPVSQRRRIRPPQKKNNPIKVVGLNSVPSKPIVENVEKTSKINEERSEKVEQAKKAILAICSPVILEHVGDEAEASVCAQACISKLKEYDRNIDSEVIKTIFTADDFIEFSKQEGLHDIAKAMNRVPDLEIWLKELYEFISQPIVKKPEVVVVNSQPTL